MERNHEVKVRLSDEEFEVLSQDTKNSGRSRETYLRSLIAKRPIKSRPSADLVSVLKNLQQINNNLNQIAMKVNTLNFVDTVAYWDNVALLKKTIQELLEVMYG